MLQQVVPCPTYHTYRPTQLGRSCMHGVQSHVVLTTQLATTDVIKIL